MSLISGIFAINLISAYGSYSSFSVNNFLYNLDSSTFAFVLGFVFFFALINYGVSRTIKNKATSGIIAFCGSAFIMYWAYRYNFNITGVLYNIGFSTEVIDILLPIIVIAGIIYLFYKFKSKTLIVLGTLMILASFTDLIYEKGLLVLVAVILIGIGFWMNRKKKIK